MPPPPGADAADALHPEAVAPSKQLVPAVETWLARSSTPDQIARTLTANLLAQTVPVHHLALLLEYRLTTLLPPPLPMAPPGTTMPSPRPAPPPTCDGCERAFSTHDPHALCRDSRVEGIHSAA
ncbi:hypothetical protein OOK36_13400 [Streptomyces sp. NBC_00365]|uniref:hypothetical protein n=1 Tax=Streptomyces sp. NBC_00365 TaxID=2975726 RepID=UPI00225ABF75|nr:hypothetical protein [Streptomyces sp. NBC_00365]MCX5089880.1 hypothetical protein [Streptomyces sp. NBC_00365]